MSIIVSNDDFEKLYALEEFYVLVCSIVHNDVYYKKVRRSSVRIIDIVKDYKDRAEWKNYQDQ